MLRCLREFSDFFHGTGGAVYLGMYQTRVMHRTTAVSARSIDRIRLSLCACSSGISIQQAAGFVMTA